MLVGEASVRAIVGTVIVSLYAAVEGAVNSVADDVDGRLPSTAVISRAVYVEAEDGPWRAMALGEEACADAKDVEVENSYAVPIGAVVCAVSVVWDDDVVGTVAPRVSCAPSRDSRLW